MQNDQSDLELVFKKRARRRLVGAIALVLLMVILLPMLLKDRTKTQPQQEIAIVMPQSGTDKMLENPVSTDGVTSDKEVVELSKSAPTAIEQKVESEKQIELAKPKTAPNVAAESKAASKPASKPKVADKIEKDTQKTDNLFYVQIGVFAEQANIKKLQVKLDELGYRSVTEKISTDTGEKTRLRTISFAGKNEAVIALENIKDAGLTGMVVSQK